MKRFANHKATLMDYGDVKILDFKDPDCNTFHVRFLFDESQYTLHITGDLGYLTAVNRSNMTYEGFWAFLNSPCYFEEKVIDHSRPFYEYHEDKAYKELLELISTQENAGQIATLLSDRMDSWADDTWSKADVANEILAIGFDDNGLSGEVVSILEDVLGSDISSLYRIGRESTGILQVYLAAFELAVSKLQTAGTGNHAE